MKKINLTTLCFLLLTSFFLTSCKDLFLRFKYQTIECQENSFGLKRISIKKDSIGSLADVQFGDIYHKIEISKSNSQILKLENKDLDIEIEIQKDKDVVDVRLRNIIKKLNCKKSTFRM